MLKHQELEQEQGISIMDNEHQTQAQSLENLDNDEQNLPPKHKNKFKIIYDGLIHISVGPDYHGLIFGMLMLLCAGTGVLLLASKFGHGQKYLMTGKILHFICICFYTLTAFSNPGIYDANQNIQPKIKFCHTCSHFIPKKVYHCHSCQACIQGYDHHCPWTSKCIGKGNIITFYIFVTSLSVFSIYMYYTFYLVYKSFRI